MHIILFRNGSRALFMPAGKNLLDGLCSSALAGHPVSEMVAEMRLSTPMPGIHPATVLPELLRQGFCAMDVYGVVHFQGPAIGGIARQAAWLSQSEAYFSPSIIGRICS
ncbi:hypothetical protein LMG19282_03850 [Cupriavidus campinensis]|uniref:hypothetical protein n=1 Tax=Cupriavidus campinensis TaxID=151783 RepID=UPI001B0A7684|nr:hypothetical protein [Cupriavidus campinensis]CAG2150783.1 hypothetical protein LMG19282_03850 [Cupriavidus campinensis]